MAAAPLTAAEFRAILDRAGYTDGLVERLGWLADHSAGAVAKTYREAAGTVAALKKVDTDWVNARAAYDDATAAEIDGLIAARRKALQGEG